MTISKSLWVPAQNLVTTICQTDSPKHTGTHHQICLTGITNCWFAWVFLEHWICLVLRQINYISTHSVQNGEGLMMLKLITLVKKSRECREECKDVQEPSGLTLWTSAGSGLFSLCLLRSTVVKHEFQTIREICANYPYLWEGLLTPYIFTQEYLLGFYWLVSWGYLFVHF